MLIRSDDFSDSCPDGATVVGPGPCTNFVPRASSGNKNHYLYLEDLLTCLHLSQQMDRVVREKGQSMIVGKVPRKKCPLLVLQEQQDEKSCEAEKAFWAARKKGPTWLPKRVQRLCFCKLTAQGFCCYAQQCLEVFPGVSVVVALISSQSTLLIFSQIPHFEWNSMVLSTKSARMDYLRERIFGDGKS